MEREGEGSDPGGMASAPDERSDDEPRRAVGGTSADLRSDLRALGENLRDALRAAWESQERERLQAEIEQGLKALGQALGQTFEGAAGELRDRERLRARMVEAREEVKAKVAGARELSREQAAERVRGEIHDLLSHLNEQLRRSKSRWTPGSGTEGSQGGASE